MGLRSAREKYEDAVDRALNEPDPAKRRKLQQKAEDARRMLEKAEERAGVSTGRRSRC